MSAYLSNILTHTTSRYNSLRRTLLSSEDDGDTEEDTHICRVLRAHYTEKGRPFPQWLPPDPKEKKNVAQQNNHQGGYGSYLTSAGGRSQYGSAQNNQGGAGGNRGSSSLNDLWDPPSGGQPNASAQPQSLRNARRPMSNQPAGASSTNLAPPQARPLPSQRAGSYQSMNAQPPQGSRPNSRVEPGLAPVPSGGSAQERLKARLWGGKGNTSPSASPALSSVGAPNPYDQPQGGGGGGAYGGGGNPYDRGGGQSNPYDRGGGDTRRYGR
ncbi:Putative mso1 domain-containing protein [Septoria linicola]|uniref:Mso1 domain-containing protein n=1 Tax=Septoria linicola TaxID=215465 RepID=A0A9Q9EGM0_9PEZI|nr:Putative mso1 domain-containing protein [Septoria linicola]